MADIDGNGRQDILFEASFQQAFGAWLIADSGAAAAYHEVASGVSSFYRYITTSAAGDPYVLSQSASPASVAVRSLYQFNKLVADPATGRVTTASQSERAPATPGVFRVEGGVERIAYDPAAPSAVQILAITGLEDRYDGGDQLNLLVKARNHAFNPNTKLTVTFSTNDVLGDSDDVAAPAQDLAIDYGADREQTVTLTPPLLQGSYYVILSVDGDAAGNQWVSPGPVEIMSNPPLQISTNYERGWYVESEPLIIDVTVRDDGVFPLPAGVPVEVEVLTYSPDNRLNWVLIGSDRQVYDEGLASDESRTFQLELVPRGLRIIARASWPGGSVEEYQETVGEVRPQERFVNRGDLDGDGDDDLIYPNAQGIEAWILENGQRLSTETITTNRAVTGVGDLDGDGIDEVLVFGASGTQALRLGAADPVAGVVPSDVPADRRAIAIGDVNGDGVDDIIWSSSADSVIRASLRSPDGYSWRDLGTHSGQGWSLQGLADLDADGDDDLLWYHYDAAGVGAMGAWLVSVDGASQWLELPASRVPQHFGDFNGDGRTDLLSKQNGVFEVRLMNADLTTSSHTIERGEEGWRLIAVADINSDGTDDLVWRSPDHWTVKAELMRDGVAYDWQTVFEP